MAKTRRLHLDADVGTAVSSLATEPTSPEAAYVFALGAGADMEHFFMARIADGLADRRIASLRYQFPYMEAGNRRVDSPAVAHATVRAAVALAAARWPGVPLFAGGKSIGGRMISQAQAAERLMDVRGLVFLGFPLHPADKPCTARADHLFDLRVTMLFVRGTRDALAEARPFDEVFSRLGATAARVDIEEADHGFDVLRRSGRNRDEELAEVLDAMASWMREVGPPHAERRSHPPPSGS